MTMGVDIYLASIFNPWCDRYWDEREREYDERHARGLPPDDGVDRMERTYQDYESTGAYFRNGYNGGDLMWAMGRSWHSVYEMCDVRGQEHYLPIDRARELIAMIEAQPLTRESVARHIFENMSDGRQPGIQQMLDEAVAKAQGVPLLPVAPPDVDELLRFLSRKRKTLLVLLRRSVEMNEPLLVS
jgi:hypothetical protein